MGGVRTQKSPSMSPGHPKQNHWTSFSMKWPPKKTERNHFSPLSPVFRILQPTGLATLTSTISLFLWRRVRQDGFNAFIRTRTSVLWPHELLAAIFEFHPRAFARYILGGGPDRVQEFWRTMPPRRGLGRRPGWQRWCIPLGLHGDGVAVAHTRGKGAKTADTLSWSSLLSSAATRFSSYLIFFVYHHITKNQGLATTWGSLWHKLAQSFQIIFNGVWPATTLDGSPEPRSGQQLAGGFWGVLYVNKGDLDWMAGHFKLPHASSNYPCALCQCSNLGHGQDIHPWTDTNNQPSWEETCWTDQAACGTNNWGGAPSVWGIFFNLILWVMAWQSLHSKKN